MVAPPRRRHRDAVSVLRALASCVTPHLGLPAYGCALEPWLGAPGLRQRSNRLALSAGRNAARHVARRYLANDLTALATEVPRIDCLMPLQTGESIRKEFAEGAISQQEAMERLLLLLAPKDAWELYKDAGDTKWDANTLHRLLDLQCATNSGLGGPGFFENLPFTDRGSLPEPEELFYAAENRVLEAQRVSKISKSIASLEELETEEEVENEEEPEKDDSEKTKFDAEEVLSAEPSSWHKGCRAEQLWAAHSNVLRSSAAYAAMIRGAARFGAADRAWELAEEAVAASHKLPLLVYNDLLRCAHECSNSDDVWLRLCRGFELLRNAKLPPNATTFTFALFSLYKSNTNALRGGKSLDYVDKALGLLCEARCLGIQPTLGLYANLLRTVLTSRLAQSGRGYRLTELLADVLADLETRCWEEISRADIFASTEDYDFVNTAMTCASVDSSSSSSLQLVQRVYDLLHTRCGDRRFLLRNSLEERNFYSRYLLTKLLHGSGEVNELRDLYRHHRQIFHADQGVYKALIRRLKSVTARWEETFERLKQGGAEAKEVDRETLEVLEASASLAYEVLGEMIFDFVAITTRLPRRLPVHVSDSLTAFSFVDPWCEVRLSPLHSRPALRAIPEAGSRAAHRAAAVFMELLRCEEARIAATSSTIFIAPLSTAELTALVRMALHPTAFNTGADGQLTVAQREANERALACATDLLMISRGPVANSGVCVSDVGAVEVLRACWRTDPEVMTERIWNLLEYLAGLKHVSEQCVQHVFVKDGSFGRLLDAAEASLTPETSTNSCSAEASPSPLRLQVVTAIRRKFRDHDAPSVSSG
ncbi:pentatricopeptide repeat containing protein 3 [Echinococcus multilocularis]|uniref:Pentatricopeptide repeat containing protein 3 n=1 Tax=Echinococcus multilocularis TaxID=6211 RepID=A0A087W0M2_ECHMU|nr:pentatricopeptide repeat containing protein 3 [Echinococcus multilocularis]